MGFPGGSSGKESACSEGDLDSIPGLGRSSGGGCSNPFQYSCLENPHGQRSLMGYSSQGHKESDMTKRLSTVQPLRSGATGIRQGSGVNSSSDIVTSHLCDPGEGKLLFRASVSSSSREVREVLTS